MPPIKRIILHQDNYPKAPKRAGSANTPQVHGKTTSPPPSTSQPSSVDRVTLGQHDPQADQIEKLRRQSQLRRRPSIDTPSPYPTAPGSQGSHTPQATQTSTSPTKGGTPTRPQNTSKPSASRNPSPPKPVQPRGHNVDQYIKFLEEQRALKNWDQPTSTAPKQAITPPKNGKSPKVTPKVTPKSPPPKPKKPIALKTAMTKGLQGANTLVSGGMAIYDGKQAYTSYKNGNSVQASEEASSAIINAVTACPITAPIGAVGGVLDYLMAVSGADDAIVRGANAASNRRYSEQAEQDMRLARLLVKTPTDQLERAKHCKNDLKRGLQGLKEYRSVAVAEGRQGMVENIDAHIARIKGAWTTHRR